MGELEDLERALSGMLATPDCPHCEGRPLLAFQRWADGPMVPGLWEPIDALDDARALVPPTGYTSATCAACHRERPVQVFILLGPHEPKAKPHGVDA